VFYNPLWELDEQIARHFESCRRTSPTTTMDAFVLVEWAEFNEVTRHWELYHELLVKIYLFTRQLVDALTKQEVMALAPWPIRLWLVYSNCGSNDSAPITPLDVLAEPPSVPIPGDGSTQTTATLRHFPPDATAMLIDLTEARPLIRAELSVKTRNGGHLIS
jgi:hypothetical protein